MISADRREVPPRDRPADQKLAGNRGVSRRRRRESNDHRCKLVSLPHRTGIARADRVAASCERSRHLRAMVCAASAAACGRRGWSRSRNHWNKEWPQKQKQNRTGCQPAHLWKRSERGYNTVRWYRVRGCKSVAILGTKQKTLSAGPFRGWTLSAGC